MGDQKCRLLERLLDLQHPVAEQQSRLLVESGEWLVHQQNLRRRRKRARNGHALAHAAGELGGMASFEPVETDHVDQMPRAIVSLALRHSRNLERKRDVFDHASPRECRLFLKDHADRGVRAANRLATDGHASLVIAEESADDVEQCRLAAARRSDHRQEFAALDLK